MKKFTKTFEEIVNAANGQEDAKPTPAQQKDLAVAKRARARLERIGLPLTRSTRAAEPSRRIQQMQAARMGRAGRGVGEED